jgi:hypothetical protein
MEMYQFIVLERGLCACCLSLSLSLSLSLPTLALPDSQLWGYRGALQQLHFGRDLAGTLIQQTGLPACVCRLGRRGSAPTPVGDRPVGLV